MAQGLTRVTLASGDDVVPVEEPLVIVVDDAPFVVVMRTPTGGDDDAALAAGLLWSEGVIADPDDLAALAHFDGPEGARVQARLAAGVPAPRPRAIVSTSACGLCGRERIDDVLRRVPERRPARAPLGDADVTPLAELARPRQALFAATGAVHAAALFEGARLVDLKEDVGRHNATDKLLGRAFLDGRAPALGACTLWVSGRVAFEIVQKAVVAGVRGVVGVGGTTSLAVDLARRADLPLAAFARGPRYNLYR